MIEIHNIEQSSEEWFEFRKGKLTGSNATAIGANGAGLKTYCKKVAAELCGKERSQFTNSEIERGNELEPYGVATYELTTGYDVDIVGCVTNSKYYNVLISPDGLVGDDGGIEIKARNDDKHFSLIMGDEKKIPFNQIQMCLLVTEREWWDFVSINTNFSKPIFIKRIFPDEKYFKKLLDGFDSGNKLINEYLEKYNNYKAI